MREYNFKDIKEIDNQGIILRDGYIILFEECRYEWSKEKDVELNSTFCVGERSYLDGVPYFLFYTKDRVKIYCKANIFFKKKRSEKVYDKLRILLNDYGYSSYDLT